MYEILEFLDPLQKHLAVLSNYLFRKESIAIINERINPITAESSPFLTEFLNKNFHSMFNCLSFGTKNIFNPKYHKLFGDLKENFCKKIQQTFSVFIEYYLCTLCGLFKYILTSSQSFENCLIFNFYLSSYFSFNRFSDNSNNLDLITRFPNITEFLELSNKLLKGKLVEKIKLQSNLIVNFYYEYIQSNEKHKAFNCKLLVINVNTNI